MGKSLEPLGYSEAERRLEALTPEQRVERKSELLGQADEIVKRETKASMLTTLPIAMSSSVVGWAVAVLFGAGPMEYATLITFGAIGFNMLTGHFLIYPAAARNRVAAQNYRTELVALETSIAVDRFEAATSGLELPKERSSADERSVSDDLPEDQG